MEEFEIEYNESTIRITEINSFQTRTWARNCFILLH